MRHIDREYEQPPKIMTNEREISNQIIQHSTLSVLLFMLHLEVITQQHYTHAFQDNNETCPHITRILEAHWIEESQHANIDYIEISALAPTLTDADKITAIIEYTSFLDTLLELFKKQAQLDTESFIKHCKLELQQDQIDDITQCQLNAYKTLFISTGLSHRQMESVIEEHPPNAKILFQQYRQQYS